MNWQTFVPITSQLFLSLLFNRIWYSVCRFIRTLRINIHEGRSRLLRYFVVVLRNRLSLVSTATVGVGYFLHRMKLEFAKAVVVSRGDRCQARNDPT